MTLNEQQVEQFRLETKRLNDLKESSGKREWVGLTDKELIDIELSLRIPTRFGDAYDLSLNAYGKTIEAKLKEKNR